MEVWERLREPSTWAGIAALASGFGWLSVVEAATVAEVLPAVINGAAGLVAVLKADQKKADVR